MHERHGDYNSRLYRIWANMVQRCTNKNNNGYKNYGGRGISISEEWRNSYKVFQEWSLENGYKENLSIDRVDNNSNYSIGNCRWATRRTQNRNTRKLRADNKSGYRGVNLHKNRWQSRISIDGKRITIGAFSTKEEAAFAYDNYVISNKLEHTINNIKETA